MELLQKHFDTALESPNGIKKLRELILTLAMQGKLVPQDPNDQRASELLKEIQMEKERIASREGAKARSNKELPPIKLEELPYEVPQGWVWTRLGNIFLSLKYGTSHKCDSDKGTSPVLRIPNLSFGKIDLNDLKYTDLTKKEKDDLSLEMNDLLIVRSNGSQSLVGRSALVGKEAIGFAFAGYLMRLRMPTNKIYANFLHNVLESQFIRILIEYPLRTTSGVKNINTLEVSQLLIPLPPLAEQKRIVAKIDELMALCDTLDAQRKTRSEKIVEVHRAAIHKLLESPNTTSSLSGFAPSSAPSSFEFLYAHFNPLYSVKENVTELKKAILTLAMQGRLVKQDPKDQQASELLKEIQVEKERIASREGAKARRNKELPPIKLEEVPYTLPEGWVWTRLVEIGEINPRNHFNDNEDAGFVPMPRIFSEFGIKHSFEIRKWSEIKKGYTHFKDGDIGLAKITPCFENGKSCVFEDLPNSIGAGTTELHIFRNTFSVVLSAYVLLYIKNPRYILEGQNKMTGSAGQKRVPSDYFSNNPFPLPPLAEQKRIVAKIDELMALCDKLENQIDQATDKQTALFDAVLAAV